MNLAELAAKHGTDKEPNYLRNYARHFDPLREREIHLLELGIFEGSSLKMWRDFFPNGLIAGLDLDPVEVDGCRTYAGSQDDVTVLDRIVDECGPFDIVIDDAAHIADPARTSLWHLWPHLRVGGHYVIEDWGTGYWADWPDGKRYRNAKHVAGMVGLIKELVDECARADITHPRGTKEEEVSRLEYMEVAHGQVILVKAR